MTVIKNLGRHKLARLPSRRGWASPELGSSSPAAAGAVASLTFFFQKMLVKMLCQN
jgi:hypothetical protein